MKFTKTFNINNNPIHGTVSFSLGEENESQKFVVVRFPFGIDPYPVVYRESQGYNLKEICDSIKKKWGLVSAQ